MKFLFVLNDPPYGTERAYNALRLALALAKQHFQGAVTIFLMADAVNCARKGQRTPDGFYNIERMLRGILADGQNRVLLCGTCMEARGLAEDDLIDKAARSTMDALATAVAEADKVFYV